MAKASQPAPGMFEVECPCCQATLKVDPSTRAVIHHKEKEKPKTNEDRGQALSRVKGEAAQRESAFQKSFEAHKAQPEVLAKKFDELFKQAKEDPDKGPPKREFDFD
jgi:hypothetical protein